MSRRTRVANEADAKFRQTLDSAEPVDFYGSKIQVARDRRFGSTEALASYVRVLPTLSGISSRWPRAAVPVSVRFDGVYDNAYYTSPTKSSPHRRCEIVFPPEPHRSYREFIVLHEYAHHLSVGAERLMHDAAWVDTYVELVTEVLGVEAGFILRQYFDWESG